MMRGGVGAAAGEQLGRSDSRNSVGTLSTVTKPSSHGVKVSEVPNGTSDAQC